MFPANKGLILKLPHLISRTGREFNRRLGNDWTNGLQSLVCILPKNL